MGSKTERGGEARGSGVGSGGAGSGGPGKVRGVRGRGRGGCSRRPRGSRGGAPGSRGEGRGRGAWGHSQLDQYILGNVASNTASVPGAGPHARRPLRTTELLLSTFELGVCAAPRWSCGPLTPRAQARPPPCPDKTVYCTPPSAPAEGPSPCPPPLARFPLGPAATDSATGATPGKQTIELLLPNGRVNRVRTKRSQAAR